MIQQINLYRDALKQGPNKPGLNAYIYGLVLASILLLGYSLYLTLELNNIKENIQLTKQQLIEAETRAKLLQVQYPKQQINSLLTQEVSRSQNILGSLSRVIQLLTDKTSDQTQGFSRYLSALARQSIVEVWLRKITIDEQKGLNFHGSTYQPSKIPALLQKLHHEPVFQGKSFAKLIMSQSEENENLIDFTVSTTIETPEKTSHE